MALTFPLALSDFALAMKKLSIKFRLVDNSQASGLGSGQILVSQVGPRYWEADVTLREGLHRELIQMQAFVESLDGGLRSFYMYDPRCAYPQYDPDGTKLNGYTPEINAVSGVTLIRVSGLPNGYQLLPGDMIAWNYGPDSEYRALHRIVDGGTATTGTTPYLEIRPALETTGIIGRNVTLRRPSCKMIIVPDSFDPGTGKIMTTSGFTFKARQIP